MLGPVAAAVGAGWSQSNPFPRLSPICRPDMQRDIHICIPGALPLVHTDAVTRAWREGESACTCSRMQMQMHSLLCTHIIITNFCITFGSGSPAAPGAPRRRLAGCRVIQYACVSSRASRRCPAWLWFDDIWPASSSSHPTPTFVLLHRTGTDSHTTHTHPLGGPTKSAVFRGGPDLTPGAGATLGSRHAAPVAPGCEVISSPPSVAD